MKNPRHNSKLIKVDNKIYIIDGRICVNWNIKGFGMISNFLFNDIKNFTYEIFDLEKN